MQVFTAVASVALAFLMAGCFESFRHEAPAWQPGDTWTFGYEGGGQTMTWTVVNTTHQVDGRPANFVWAVPSGPSLPNWTRPELLRIDPGGFGAAQVRVTECSAWLRPSPPCRLSTRGDDVAEFPLVPGRWWEVVDPPDFLDLFNCGHTTLTYEVGTPHAIHLGGLGQLMTVPIEVQQRSGGSPFLCPRGLAMTLEYSPDYRVVAKVTPAQGSDPSCPPSPVQRCGGVVVLLSHSSSKARALNETEMAALARSV